MYMTDSEILSKYSKADNKKEMLQILADLNGCDKGSMKEFLLEHGISESDFAVKRGRKPKVKQDAEKNTEEVKEQELPELKPIKSVAQMIEEPNLTPEEQIRLDRALAIPMPVRQAISDRIEALTEKVIEIEKERDCLCDFLEGRVTEYAGS